MIFTLIVVMALVCLIIFNLAAVAVCQRAQTILRELKAQNRTNMGLVLECQTQIDEIYRLTELLKKHLRLNENR